MACAPIASGSVFLKSTLKYLDCAGQQLGASGYQSLTAPGSIIGQIILTMLTLLIAWQGCRMIFGHLPEMGAVVLVVAKIGFVLMLVSSWPAVRTLFYAPSFNGPMEIQSQASGATSPPIEDRLQRVDNGIVALTSWGTGRLDIRAGRTVDGQPAASSFSGIGLADSLAFGASRLCYLVGSLMTLGLFRLLAGVLIAALPLFAGFLLFDTGRSLFMGWLRMVFAVFVASISIPMILTAELSLLEPWLARVIAERAAFYATPSAPTELLAICGAFFLILLGSTAMLVRLCFLADMPVARDRLLSWRPSMRDHAPAQGGDMAVVTPREHLPEASRAESIARMLQVVSQRAASSTPIGAANVGYTNTTGAHVPDSWAGPSGSTLRPNRASLRVNRSSIKRDHQ